MGLYGVAPLRLGWRNRQRIPRFYQRDELGVPDVMQRVHWDPEFARRAGNPTTFCVDDTDDPSLGMCVPKEQAEDRGCKPYDHFVVKTRARHTQPAVTAKVCVPGSPGWVGDHCFADADCAFGTSCEAGICTVACDRYCSDQPGWAETFVPIDFTRSVSRRSRSDPYSSRVTGSFRRNFTRR